MFTEWTKEYKDEIGSRYLIQGSVPVAEDLQSLCIQDLAFLTSSAHYFHDNKTFVNDNFLEKAAIFETCLLDRIKNADKLYILYAKHTGYPFIWTNSNGVLLYSNKAFACAGVEHFKQEAIELEYHKIEKEEIDQNFAELYRIGIENIIIDMCDEGYRYQFTRSQILPSPDWGNTPQISIPIYNPEVVRLLILYYQALNFSNQVNQSDNLRDITDGISVKLLRSKFLIPTKWDRELASDEAPDEEGKSTLKADTKIMFPILEDTENVGWTPIFTDWQEFKKLYNSEEWKGQIVTFEDAVTISRQNGIVLNPKGTPLRISDEQKKIMEFSLVRLKEIDELINNRNVTNIHENMYIGDLREKDKAAIDEIKMFCKRNKAIKKAYVRLKIENDIMSYLLIIDFKGDKQDLFLNIAKSISTYLGNMYLDIHEYDDLGKKLVADTKPIYKKLFV